MTVTISTEPTYIVPGKEAQITASCSVGNWVDVVLTAAPAASQHQKKLDDEGREELPLWSSQAGIKHGFTFDVPGRYVCTLREITKSGINFKGGYAGDPDSYRTETINGTTSYSFVVGQRMTGQIRLPGNESGTLNLFVWNSTIRATTVVDHGEVTPRIDANSEKMQTAVAASAVTTALAALDGVATTTAVTSLSSVANDIIDKFNAHRTQASVHSSNDTDNAINTDYKGANNPAGISDLVREICAKFRYHFTNDAAGSGISSAGYHTRCDWDNLPILTGASDMLTAGLALASIWHSYETHRLDTNNVHSVQDTTNTLSSLPPLIDVWRNVIAVISSDNPTTPATENPGAAVLVHRAGLTRS